MSRRTKILLVLALFVGLVPLFLLPHNGYRSKVEAYKKQLIAKGEKLTMAELAPPPPPDNVSNGAKAFLNLMGNYQQPNDYPTPRKMVAPGLAMIGCTNISPADMLSYGRNVSNVANLRMILDEPVLDFKPDYSQPNHLMTTLVSELTDLKKGEILPEITEEQALYLKHSAEARSDLLAAADLIRLYTNEPLMISGLVRAADLQIAAAGVWDGLQCIEWTDPQLAELQAKWQDMDFFETCETAVRMERAWTIADLAEMRNTNALPYIAWPGPALSASMPTTASGTFADLQDKLKEFYDRYPRFWRWRASWSYEEELCYLQMMDAALASCRLAETTGAFVPANNRFNTEASNICQLHPDGTNHFLFGNPSGGSYGRYLVKLAQAETARRLTVAAIALKRYHLQHGAYPATLNDLVPDLIPAVPIDFMDGKPLRYKLRPDGDFLLYSVGPDGLDDGGDPRPTDPSLKSQYWLYGRDMVWPRVATPAALEEYRQKYGAITNGP